MTRLTRSRRARRLACLATPWLAACLLAYPARGAEPGANREAMADAMSRMMEAMGVLGSAAGTLPVRPDMAGLPGALGLPGVPGIPAMPPIPGMTSPPGTAAAGRLEGVWEAAGGGLLIVQGGNYRLYSPAWAFMDGTIQVTDQRVRMTSGQGRAALDLEYALDQGRLAMRDGRGQVYLYRRLVLTGGG